LLSAVLALCAVAQKPNLTNEHRQARTFEYVQSEFAQLRSLRWIGGRDQFRIGRANKELADLQTKLDHGHFDQPELDDLIEILSQLANNNLISPYDREVLLDGVKRLKAYRDGHQQSH
jgi:hypothetical protein